MVSNIKFIRRIQRSLKLCCRWRKELVPYPPAISVVGFTLIELSIVLVIIGLIVGGVLVGQDLIRAAQLRKIPQEVSTIETALYTFRLKYDCVPGDCNKASQFFLGATNGNGDKVINGDDAPVGEHDYVWHHLGEAGITQPFTPVTLSTDTRVGGVNVYGTVAGKGGYVFRDGLSYALYGRVGSKLQLGSEVSNSMPIGAIFTINEARSLDEKMDDGLASGGQVYATTGSGSGACTDKAYTGTAPATYQVSDDIKRCRMFFWQD